jgi:DNA-directed RNA polymerase specialized sigma24 family protein
VAEQNDTHPDDGGEVTDDRQAPPPPVADRPAPVSVPGCFYDDIRPRVRDLIRTRYPSFRNPSGTPNDDHVNEIVQDVVVRLQDNAKYGKARDLDHLHAQKSIVVQRVVIDRLRRLLRYRDEDPPAGQDREPVARELGPQDNVIASEMLARLENILKDEELSDKLPLPHREVAQRQLLKKQSVAEIAQEMGVPERTVTIFLRESKLMTHRMRKAEEQKP